MRIFIACLGTETNTFSSLPTGAETFAETMLFEGEATRHPPSLFSRPLFVWREMAEAKNHTVIEGLAEYKVSKTFSLGGGVSIYNSAESHPGPNMDPSKEFGTELNAGFKWVIHPRLELRAVGAVIMRGDYGREVGGTEADDGWAVGWTLRHIF